MERLQTRFWDWATRNAIRIGTVVVVARVVGKVLHEHLRAKENEHDGR